MFSEHIVVVRRILNLVNDYLRDPEMMAVTMESLVCLSWHEDFWCHIDIDVFDKIILIGDWAEIVYILMYRIIGNMISFHHSRVADKLCGMVVIAISQPILDGT
jgi:hypothetical protein